MKSPWHHLKNPEGFFEHLHKEIHHAFGIFGLAIIGMLWGASTILTSASANRQWGGFLNSDFWSQNPTDANIMYSLFGDGTAGATAYTRVWNSSCVPTNVTVLSGGFVGMTGSANTIYILNPGTYTITRPIVMNTCSVLLGNGEVILKTNTGGAIIDISGKTKVIVDNVFLSGNLSASSEGIRLQNAQNITVNSIKSYQSNIGLHTTATTNILISNSRFLKNTYGAYIDAGSANVTINNILSFDNLYGISSYDTDYISINNSQIFNNNYGMYLEDDAGAPGSIVIHNSLAYNNNFGIDNAGASGYLYNIQVYNNNHGISNHFTNGSTEYYGTLHMFNNALLTGGVQDIIPGSSVILDRPAGTLDTSETGFSYDRTTNPQNSSGQRLLSGNNRTGSRGILPFDPIRKPIRYIFGGNIIKQVLPVWYDGNTLANYGNDGSDYTTNQYIGELDSTLAVNEQLIVNQYFGPTSLFTQNRLTNGCSLSAFQIVYLSGGQFNSVYNFQDHTIYILTGNEYKSALGTTGHGFVFNGNCIALIGTKDTRFTKQGMIGMTSILYANNKRNLIIDTIKVDGLYFNDGYLGYTSLASQIGVNLAGNTNNNTINNVQSYNNQKYGIYLGLGSHHNTIINTQSFNNTVAGIHLYYSSNYNVINNTQTYNNGTYGIRFANGSHRNTLNNFQTYNNTVGIFGDLTTQENVFNRVVIYNNGDAGVYLKNSSGNVLNDVSIYNNTVGIRTLYSSLGNTYYGELRFFANGGGDFDGTSGDDGYLSAGSSGLFPYGGILTTGTDSMSCLYATNPTFSGNGTTSTLLNSGTCINTGASISPFQSSYNAYVNYAFGLGMYKQRVPVRYDSGNNLIQIPSQYDSTKYIAEIFAIRDTTPENVHFIGSGAAPLNSRYTTNIYTVGIINIAVPVTLALVHSTTGYLTISGINVGLTGVANNGDPIQISLLTQPGYTQTTTGTITLGSVTSIFTVTTRGYNQLPDSGSLAFANLTSLPFNTFTGSTTTVIGIETGVLASIGFVPTNTLGWLEIYSGNIFISSGTTGLKVYNGNQINAIGQSSSGYAQTVTGIVTIGLGTGIFTLLTKGSDAIPPTTPNISYPINGESLFFITFEWTASTDTGSGLQGYEYQIARNNTFSNVIETGFIATSTGTIGSPDTSFNVIHNTYYWRMRAQDRDGNYSARSNSGYFSVSNLTNRDFPNITDANLRTFYDSNEITLSGIKANTSLRASLDEYGILYKNGNNVGTGTLVQNGDDIFISLKSSNSYDDTISSVLTLANRTLEFSVTTKQEHDNGCTLSDTDKTTVQTIFDSLVENYLGDADKLDTFLYTMKSMLADEIDFTNDCNLQYLEDLINSEIGINFSGSITTGTHIAPNCKEYAVSFDSTRMAYTSPSFKVITYFINRDALGRYIDSKNPGDCHLNTYDSSSWSFVNADQKRHIAPNGKVYSIQSTTQGYTSNEFSSPKYFRSVAELRSYIDTHNAPQQIWNHQVDTNFTPQTYNAPNGKSYSIYKTDRGYMSYKLLSVRYFPTLEDIQAFINKNNKN